MPPAGRRGSKVGDPVNLLLLPLLPLVAVAFLPVVAPELAPEPVVCASDPVAVEPAVPVLEATLLSDEDVMVVAVFPWVPEYDRS